MMKDEGKDLRRRDFVRLAGISLGAFAISDVLTRAFSIGGRGIAEACCDPAVETPPPPPGCDPTVDPPPPPPCCDPDCDTCEGVCQPCDGDNPCCDPPCQGNDVCCDPPCQGNDACCDPPCDGCEVCEPNDAGCAICDNEGCPRCETGDVCVFECCDPPCDGNDI